MSRLYFAVLICTTLVVATRCFWTDSAGVQSDMSYLDAGENLFFTVVGTNVALKKSVPDIARSYGVAPCNVDTLNVGRDSSNDAIDKFKTWQFDAQRNGGDRKLLVVEGAEGLTGKSLNQLNFLHQVVDTSSDLANTMLLLLWDCEKDAVGITDEFYDRDAQHIPPAKSAPYWRDYFSTRLHTGDGIVMGSALAGRLSHVALECPNLFAGVSEEEEKRRLKKRNQRELDAAMGKYVELLDRARHQCPAKVTKESVEAASLAELTKGLFHTIDWQVVDIAGYTVVVWPPDIVTMIGALVVALVVLEALACSLRRAKRFLTKENKYTALAATIPPDRLSDHSDTGGISAPPPVIGTTPQPQTQPVSNMQKLLLQKVKIKQEKGIEPFPHKTQSGPMSSPGPAVSSTSSSSMAPSRMAVGRGTPTFASPSPGQPRAPAPSPASAQSAKAGSAAKGVVSRMRVSGDADVIEDSGVRSSASSKKATKSPGRPRGRPPKGKTPELGTSAVVSPQSAKTQSPSSPPGKAVSRATSPAPARGRSADISTTKSPKAPAGRSKTPARKSPTKATPKATASGGAEKRASSRPKTRRGKKPAPSIAEEFVPEILPATAGGYSLRTRTKRQ
jgi:hypothetical protein